MRRTFARDVTVGAGLVLLVVLIAVAWASLGRVSEWLEETVQRAVEEALRDEMADARAESGVAGENLDEAVQEAVDEVVEDAERFIRDLLAAPRGRDLGSPMSAEAADRVMRFNISVMTRRHRMDTIEGGDTLRQVDIGTSRRLGLLRARLGSSVRATFPGSLNEQAFQENLGLSIGTTVRDAAGNLKRAFDRAWSDD